MRVYNKPGIKREVLFAQILALWRQYCTATLSGAAGRRDAASVQAKRRNPAREG